MSGGRVDVFVVYARPDDHPTVPFVVRRQTVFGDEIVHDPDAYGFDRIRDVHNWLLLQGLTMLLPSPDDDPKIIEVWL